MSYPQPPEIATSYSGAEQALGDGSLPGQELDVDFAAVRASITSAIEFLKGITRSDGALANGIVTQESLAASIVIGFDTPAVWATATDYTTSSLVFEGAALYLCTTAHTSSVFATDLASGRWSLLADLTPPGGGLLASNNLSDVADAGNSRANLGLGSMATASASAYRTNVEQDLAFQPLAANLTAWAALVGAANKLGYFTGTGTADLTDLTAFARQILDDADAATARGTLGLGALATRADITTAQVAAATLVTASETIGSNNNDTTLPTSAAVKAYADSLLVGVDIPGAIAALAVGAVGTYAMLRFASVTTAAPGSTHAGSGLRYANASNTGLGTTPAGTWRLMGETTNSSVETSTSLFLRIS